MLVITGSVVSRHQVTLSQSCCGCLGVGAEWYWDRAVLGSISVYSDFLLLVPSLLFSSQLVPIRHDIPSIPHANNARSRNFCSVREQDPIDEPAGEHETKLRNRLRLPYIQL